MVLSSECFWVLKSSSLFREIQDEELKKFCSRISKLLQAEDLGPDTLDSLQRLFLIISATKYNRRLEKTCVDLLQATLGLATCPEQLQVLCAAILREMSPSDSLSLVWDHTQNSRQLNLVASVLLAQVVQQSPPQLAVLPQGSRGLGCSQQAGLCPLTGTNMLRGPAGLAYPFQSTGHAPASSVPGTQHRHASRRSRHLPAPAPLLPVSPVPWEAAIRCSLEDSVRVQSLGCSGDIPRHV